MKGLPGSRWRLAPLLVIRTQEEREAKAHVARAFSWLRSAEAARRRVEELRGPASVLPRPTVASGSHLAAMAARELRDREELESARQAERDARSASAAALLRADAARRRLQAVERRHDAWLRGVRSWREAIEESEQDDRR